MGWLFVPGLEDWKWGSPSCSENAIAPCVSSNGMLSPRPLSWIGWRFRPWIARLSGTILQPSMAEHGAAAWISSLAATRASRSPSPASDVERAILGICGRKFSVSLKKSSRRSVSSKTSRATFGWATPKSEPTFEELATRLRKDCLRRQRLAQATRENGSSSWPTVRACSGNRSSGANRSDFYRVWPTPDCSDRRGPASTQKGLKNAVETWPTPTATERENDTRAIPSKETLERYARGQIKRVRKTRAPTLLTAVAQWPTPRQSDTNGSGRHGQGGLDLRTKARQWATPASWDCQGSTGGGQGRSLRTDIARWATPTGRDHKDGVCADAPVPTNSLLGRQVLRIGPDGTPSPKTTPSSSRLWMTPKSRACGSTSKTKGRPLAMSTSLQAQAYVQTRGSRRLNPLFVEWLMGFPLGWTGFGVSATQWSRYKRRMRSLLCGLILQDTRGLWHEPG